MIINRLKIVSKQLAYLAVVVALLLTLVIGAVYWLSNAVEQGQDEIADWISDKVGYPVEIGSANLDWIGLAPKLQVGDVKLRSKDNQQELISLGTFYLGLDVIASIQSRTLVLKDITLIDLQLALIRDTSGQIQLQNFILPEGLFIDDIDWKYWAQLLSRFNLEEIQIEYMDQLKPALSGQYSLENTVITHDKMTWIISGQINLPAMLGQNVVFTAEAELNNDDIQASTWHGQAKINNVRLESLTDELVWQDMSVQKGNINTHLAIKGTGTNIYIINSDLNVSDVKIASNDVELESTPVNIDLVQGKMDWKKTDQSWNLSGQLALSINGDNWPETTFSVDKNLAGNWQIVSQYLRLSDLSSLALLSNKTPEMFKQRQPAGDIESLNLQYSAEKGLTELSFKLKEGVILSWNDYPGITNLTGQVNWRNGSGNIYLDSHDVTIYAKTWLEEAVFLNALVGSVKLEYGKDTWQFYSRELRAWNDDLTLQLDGEVNKKVNEEIINDLTLSLDNITVNSWVKYVPRQRFSKKLKDWFDKAFVDGKITNGEISIKGELAAFPYEKDPEKGSFNIALEVEDLHLHYAHGYPDLTELTGTIAGSANELFIKTTHGKIAGFDFVDVTATIDKLTEKQPILRIDGDVTGTTAKALQLLKGRPLKARFGEVANSAVAQGKSNINLELIVPLDDADNTTVSGYVSFIDSQLQSKDIAEIFLSKINGKLYFNEKGVTAKNIKAKVLNEAVNINIKLDGDKTVVSILGHVSTKQLGAIWPNKVPQFISGKTAYQVDLTVVEREIGNLYFDFDLMSDLKGLTLEMPKPFGKAQAQAIPFNATMKNIDDALVFTANVVDIVNIIVKPNDELWQGEVRFGQGQAVLPKNGIKLSGQISEVSADDWLAWAENQQETEITLANSIDDVSLALGKLTGFEQTLTNLKLSSQKDAKGWRTNIHSDQAKGFIYLPKELSGSETINVNLKRLALVLPQNEQDSKLDQPKKPMELWPNMTIYIDSLSLDEKWLGKLELKANKNENSWVVNEAQLISDIFTLTTTKAIWKKLPTSESLVIELRLESSNLDSLLSNFGYQQAINAEHITMEANVSWPDDPFNFTVGTLSGSLNMDIRTGTLQDVEPSAAGRIFGLMSIAALPSLLSLDFSDLFGDDLAFDSITSDFKFKNGLATTDNFILKSASAEINITGAVDLINQRYDQQVKITPNVSSALPVVGAVAGGPVGAAIGAGILVLDKVTDKLFGKNIVNVISYKYDLTGPWNAPKSSLATSLEETDKTDTKVFGGRIQ